jgi:hypothetical protein
VETLALNRRRRFKAWVTVLAWLPRRMLISIAQFRVRLLLLLPSGMPVVKKKTLENSTVCSLKKDRRTNTSLSSHYLTLKLTFFTLFNILKKAPSTNVPGSCCDEVEYSIL